jgi:O-antigen/teichoic acid export membrane protein
MSGDETSPLPSIGRRALRGTAAYTSASVVQRSIGFALLPLYARVLTPAEYGQLGIIVTISAAAGAVLGLGLETAVFRSLIALTDRPDQRATYLNTVGGFALLVPPALAIVVSVPIGLISQAAFDVPASAVALGIIGAGLSASTAIVPFAVLRAEERLTDYLRVSSVQVLGGVTLPLLLVVLLRWGVPGWLVATAASSAIVMVSGIAILRHSWSLDFQLPYLWGALAFGLPMVPHSLSHWALAISDRAILGVFVGPADVGLYFIAYQFSIPITVIAFAAAQSVQPLFAEAAKLDGLRPALGRISTYQASIVALLVMAVALIGPPAVALMLPPSYLGATVLIPWIAVGAGLFGLYLIPMNVVTIMSGRNRWVWLVTLVAAVTNVALNLVLVPSFGVFAAAVDTVIGYAVLLVGVYGYMRIVCQERIPFEWERIGGGIALVGATIFVVDLALPSNVDLASLFVRVVALGAVGVAMSITGLLPRVGRPRRRPAAPDTPVTKA